MLLARSAMEAAGEPEIVAEAAPNCCKKCGITLSSLLASHQGVFCPACVAVCVAGILSDWEGGQRSSRCFISWLRQRKPLWLRFKRRMRASTFIPRSRTPA